MNTAAAANQRRNAHQARLPSRRAGPLIWITHLGVDRAVGYGLKYPTSFKEAHLQRVRWADDDADAIASITADPQAMPTA
jgi:hypothetical protein